MERHFGYDDNRVQEGKTLTVKAYQNGTQIGETVSEDISSWSLYNASSTYKTFMIGGCYDTRHITDLTNFTSAEKFVGTMDNIRVYDFAMTEAQMSEYATTKKITEEVEIPEPTYKANITPYIEYTFDNSASFYANTGTSASDSTKDYSLTKGGNGDIVRNGYVEMAENAVLYPTENPFVNNQSLVDFTLVMDVNAGVAGYYGSLFSFDSFSQSGNNHEKITRMDMRQPSSTEGNLFGWGDSKVHTISDSWTTWKATVYKDSSVKKNDRTVKSGNVTVVFNVDSDSSIKVRVYKDGVKVSEDTDATLTSDWSLYNESSLVKSFTIGAAFDARYFDYDTGKYTALARAYKGTMDNIRIYDFAMTEDQMEEYAKYGKVSTSGVQIAESENGKVTTNNYTPEVGEEVVFNVAPNAGYELVELKVNGETLEAVDGVYKTEMIYDGLYVEATFDLTTEGKLLKAVSMGSGAGVRYGGTADYSGLRFRIQAPKTEYENLDVTAEYGILVIPADYEKTYGKFTVENLFGANAKYHLAERDGDGNMVEYTGNLPQIMNFWTDELYYNAETDCYEYYGSITNINAKNLTRQFVGVGVAKYGDNYVVLNYAGNDIANNTRSVYQVSKLVVLDENADPKAKAWVERNYVKPVESAVSVLANKKLSVIGDSISTYAGVSNNATANSTIGGNAVFYNTQMALDDTWWKQTANNTGMEILVNNSWSSSNVAVYGDNTLTSKAGCGDRAVNLHDDTNNVNPDVIAAYIGINDCGCLTSVGDFDEVSDIWDGEKYVGEFTSFSRAYARMVHQIVTKYDGADVFLFTLPRNGYLWTGTKDEYNALQDEYNKTIRKIAEIFGCQVVELSAAVGENYSEYLLSDNIHPNAKGMDIITAAFETALYSYYTANAQ